jgi:hypothetical protein
MIRWDIEYDPDKHSDLLKWRKSPLCGIRTGRGRDEGLFAPLFFQSLLFGFTLYTESGDGTGHQALLGYLTAAPVTDAERTVLDPLNRFLHLSDQLPFPVSYPKLEIPLRFETRPVVGIGEILFLISHVGNGLAGFIQEIVDALIEQIFEYLEFFGLHRRKAPLISVNSFWVNLINTKKVFFCKVKTAVKPRPRASKKAYSS